MCACAAVASSAVTAGEVGREGGRTVEGSFFLLVLVLVVVLLLLLLLL